MSETQKILVSACLAGKDCRYDGKNNLVPEVVKLVEKGNAVPVCPEQLGGLPTPRPPAERKGDSVITQDGTDVTVEFMQGAEEVLRIAQENGCTLAILKARSPSCGKGCIYDGTFTHTKTKGNGITTELLENNGVKVITEEDLK